MLAALDIPRAWLPAVLRVAGAQRAHLRRGRGGDRAAPRARRWWAAAATRRRRRVGSGIVQQGVVSVTLGTSGVVFAATERFVLEPQGRLHAFCHAVPGQWHLMGVMLSAGGSLRWYRDALGEAEMAEARARAPTVYDLLTPRPPRRPPAARG